MPKYPFYQRLGDHIKEQKTFDMRSDTEGYPTIHWLIARSLLSDYPEYERHKLIESYVSNVKNNLYVALSYLEKNGINTYIIIPKDKKKIQFITIDESYMNAKRLDFERQTHRIVREIQSFSNNLRNKHSDKLTLFKSDAKRLSNKLESTLFLVEDRKK